MSNKTKIVVVIAVVVLLIAGYIFYTKPHLRTQVTQAVSGQLIEDNIPYFRNNGGMNTLLPITAGGGLNIGSSSTQTNNLVTGICYIDPYSATITGTTTALVDCQGTLNVDAANATGVQGSALTGVANGDNVQVLLSTTTATTASGTTPGLVVTGASASTTAGHITLRIANISGATYTWSTTLGTASGTASFISSR